MIWMEIPFKTIFAGLVRPARLKIDTNANDLWPIFALSLDHLANVEIIFIPLFVTMYPVTQNLELYTLTSFPYQNFCLTVIGAQFCCDLNKLNDLPKIFFMLYGL